MSVYLLQKKHLKLNHPSSSLADWYLYWWYQFICLWMMSVHILSTFIIVWVLSTLFGLHWNIQTIVSMETKNVFHKKAWRKVNFTIPYSTLLAAVLCTVSKIMAKTRSESEIYLLGSTISELTGSKLPSIRMALGLFLHHHLNLIIWNWSGTLA